MFTKDKNQFTFCGHRSVDSSFFLPFYFSANMDVEKLTFADLNLGRERVIPRSGYAGFLWIPQFILDHFAVCRLSVLPPPVESSSLGVITS